MPKFLFFLILAYRAGERRRHNFVPLDGKNSASCRRFHNAGMLGITILLTAWYSWGFFFFTQAGSSHETSCAVLDNFWPKKYTPASASLPGKKSRICKYHHAELTFFSSWDLQVFICGLRGARRHIATNPVCFALCRDTTGHQSNQRLFGCISRRKIWASSNNCRWVPRKLRVNESCSNAAWER